MKICTSSLPLLAPLCPWAFLLVDNASGFSPASMDRSRFLERVANAVAAAATSSGGGGDAAAIEFVPASPYFSGTYADAIEIVRAQRIALDNIADVAGEGNAEEAGFKVMQLNAQTRTAGKIILDTLQENISSEGGGDGVVLLRFLSCQKKFAILMDLCEDCSVSLQAALKEDKKVVAKAAVKKLQVLRIVEDTKSAYDDFLADLKTFEESSMAK